MILPAILLHQKKKNHAAKIDKNTIRQRSREKKSLS